MVRKRTRKYDSDNSDSDVDWDPAVASRGPAAKKYSLRERKGAQSFCEFDYLGLDEEEEARKISSEDEDFEVEADVEPMRQFYEQSEPEEPEEAQCSEGLIDFEDIIRADIVVNKNKIDYDNIIQKTEIKLTQAPPVEAQPPKRRGRKPKNCTLANELKSEIKDEIKEEEQDPENEHLEPKTETGESEIKEEPLQKDKNMTSDVNSDVVLNGDCIAHEANSKEIDDVSSIQEPNIQSVDDGQATCSTVDIDTSKASPEVKANSNIEIPNIESKSNSQKFENKSDGDDDDDDDVIVLDNNADAPVIVLDD